MRPKFVAGNWKMYTNAATATALAAAVVEGLGGETARAASPSVRRRRTCCRSPRRCAAAPSSWAPRTATPKRKAPSPARSAPSMLADVGCKWVILGHSERRHKLGETDAFINRKVHAALAAGSARHPLPRRNAGRTQGRPHRGGAGRPADRQPGRAGRRRAEARGAGLRAGLGHRHRRQRHAGTGAAGPRLHSRANRRTLRRGSGPCPSYPVRRQHEAGQRRRRCCTSRTWTAA